MMDHSENPLRAAIKCLRDTVAPALDPDDPLAVEQLRLTIDFLEFLRSRLYDLHARHRYELGCQIDVATALVDDARLVSDHAGGEIEAALAAARRVHAAADSHTVALRDASQRLWGTVRGVVRDARQAPDDVRERIGATVVAGVAPLVEVESAWYLPFGFEPQPASVPAIDELLGRAPNSCAPLR